MNEANPREYDGWDDVSINALRNNIALQIELCEQAADEVEQKDLKTLTDDAIGNVITNNPSLLKPVNHPRGLVLSEPKDTQEYLVLEEEAKNNWRLKAACRPTGGKYVTKLFFTGVDFDERAAKEICKPCVVKEECLDASKERNEPSSIWGGVLLNSKGKIPKR